MLIPATLFTLMVLLPAVVSAQVGGQLVAVGAVPFAENPDTVSDVSDSFRERSDQELFNGLEGEIWFDKVGFGARYLGRFNDLSPTQDAGQEWWYDWKGDLFLSYHLFRGGAFIDPYVRFAAGVAMRQNGDNEIVNAGIHQYVGGGGQINLGGLVIGVGLNYNLLNQPIQPDDEDWQVYPTQRFEARLYGGVTFGR